VYGDMLSFGIASLATSAQKLWLEGSPERELANAFAAKSRSWLTAVGGRRVRGAICKSAGACVALYLLCLLCV
jgi:hypothetical protein